MEHGVGLKNQVKCEVVTLVSKQGSVRQGRCQQHLKNPPLSWVKQAGKDPQSHTHRAGK